MIKLHNQEVDINLVRIFEELWDLGYRFKDVDTIYHVERFGDGSYKATPVENMTLRFLYAGEPISQEDVLKAWHYAMFARSLKKA